jgi:PKD repeat protein
VKHTFGKPGNYTVRLTVRDDDGSEARALADVFIRDTPPEAVASLSAAQADTFKRVQFLGDRSRDLEGPITFQWDFGDGNGSSESSPWHAYSLPGDYNATLTVRDSAGQNSSMTLPAVSIRNRPPKADFRVFGCFTQNGTLYFDGTGSSDPEGPVTYSWDFGDNGTGKGAVVEHVFPSAGNFAVNLTVTDANGGQNTISQTIMVISPPPPPKPPKKAVIPEDKTPTVNLLLGVVLLLVVLLAALALWGATRGAKPNAPAGGPGGEPESRQLAAGKEFSPAEEQLRGAPRH